MPRGGSASQTKCLANEVLRRRNASQRGSRGQSASRTRSRTEFLLTLYPLPFPPLVRYFPRMARETKAARAARATQIVTILEQTFPLSKIALDYRTPWELLVATILAAQCTDARVNEVTPDLFNRYPTPRALANASQEELEKVIFTTGFYRNKAKSIRGAAAAVVERFRGKVPGTMDQLLTIPGIGRKSANVILGHCFGVPGVVVDTHVKRITNLNGLVKTEDPEKIEFE